MKTILLFQAFLFFQGYGVDTSIPIHNACKQMHRFFVPCYPPSTFGQSQGVYAMHHHLFESGTTIDIGYKVVTYNNKSIQEVPKLHVIEDSSGRKFSVSVMHYSYLDPDKNVCYNYRSFSDTSKLLKYYTNIDSVVIGGGKNFYSNKAFQYDKLTALPDTVMTGISYRRARLDKKAERGHLYFIIYFRCDKKGTLVRFYNTISEEFGCPVVRIDSYYNNKFTMISEIEFLSDQLSEEEIKVFEAWGKRVRN